MTDATETFLAAQAAPDASIKLKAHKFANLYPRYEKDEFKRLCDDIEANGLHHPVTVYQGAILDGVNRYNACVKLGCDLDAIPTEEFGGTDDEALALVVSMNQHRRHLNAGQLAMIAEKLATMKAGNAKAQKAAAPGGAASKSLAEAAKQVGASRNGTSKARAVTKANPELAAKVAQGEVSLESAYTEVSKAKPKAEKKKAKLTLAANNSGVAAVPSIEAIKAGVEDPHAADLRDVLENGETDTPAKARATAIELIFRGVEPANRIMVLQQMCNIANELGWAPVRMNVSIPN